jgi:2-amino-4-hydroxy-6-hydroxymethyldihydropteridine diphosphokinase
MDLAMNKALICFGANLGDRLSYIEKALSLIAGRCGEITAVSRVFETMPIGNADQAFLNGALVCATHLEPSQMMTSLLDIELSLGRKREVKWGNRTIDLDMILWQNADGTFLESQTPELKLPHPEAARRDFVICPCREIAAEWRFPKHNLTVAEIFEREGYSKSIIKTLAWRYQA